MTLKYRPEIDGLRAFAVISVIAYHAELYFKGINLFKGGFVGVDVFFVISGYLITSIILIEQRNGTFKFARFYERRARRILPALFAILATSLLFAWMYMTPKAMVDYVKSMLSSLFFVSNFWFWMEDSYWAQPSAFKPLLHTWSLSIEEQFYILYPLCLMVIYKFYRSHLAKIFIAGSLLSLLLAQWGSSQFPDANFFLLPSRGWELMAGATLASLELEWGRTGHPMFEDFMPALGLGLIGFGVAFYDPSLKHPSLATALPVLGTLLFIWFSQPGGIITNAIGSKPFVAIGLVSYSLYLWHFPIFAFSKIKSEDISQVDKLSMMAFSLLLAVVTYFSIERPARRSPSLTLDRFTRVTFSGLTALIVVSGIILQLDGLPGRFSHVGEILVRAPHIELRQNNSRCHGRPLDKLCAFNEPGAPMTLINLGDSHADVLSYPLYATSKKLGWNYTQISYSSCTYMRDTSRLENGKPFVFCDKLNKQSQAFLENHKPAVVVYSARWIGYTEEWVKPNSSLSIEEAFRKTFESLLNAGHTLIIIYPGPESSEDLPSTIVKKLRKFPIFQYKDQFENLQITRSLDEVRKRTHNQVAMLNSLGEHPRLFRVDPEKIFCSLERRTCYSHNENEIFYQDTNHYSSYGAKLVVNEVAKILVSLAVRDKLPAQERIK